MQLAPSTVALNARQGLEAMGVGCRPSHVHPLLMLTAKAGCERTLASASLSFVSSPFGEVQVIGIPRPGRRLVGTLPTAELEVLSMLVEGYCHAQIARRRSTAERTVANQIAAVFKRLNVSGRSELIQRLFVLDGIASRPAPETMPPPPASRNAPIQSRAHDSRICGIRPLSSLNPALLALQR